MTEGRVRIEKKEASAKLAQQLRDSLGFVAVDYRGITVSEIFRLRAGLRERGARMVVTKNTVLRFALEEAGWSSEEFSDMLSGPTALVFISEDVGPTLKLLLAEVRDDFSLRVKSACIEGKTYDEKQVKALSLLPGRNELLAQLLGTLNAPAQQLAGVAQAVPQALVRVLDAAREQMEAGGS